MRRVKAYDPVLAMITPPGPVAEVTWLFLRLGVTAFGGPAAHVALIQQECVERRRWITPQEFLDLLAVASLIPGPTSTELAMHVGRIRAGWWGLVGAGLAFLVPASLLIGLLAFIYVRSGELPAVRGVLAAVAPVVIVLVLQALLLLARTAFRTPAAWLLGAAAAAAALAGVPEIVVLLAAGAIGLTRRPAVMAFVVAAAAVTVVSAAGPAVRAATGDVAGYFGRVGSLLFGSGYVLLPVLQGDLVERYGWLSERELLDAIAAGQATPGPLFTTATFIGYVLGGPGTALAATVGMFAPAFLFSAAASAFLPRLRASVHARAFLDGVNAAAVALIAVVLVTLGRATFDGPVAVAIAAVAGLSLFLWRVNAGLVLAGAAFVGAVYGAISA